MSLVHPLRYGSSKDKKVVTRRSLGIHFPDEIAAISVFYASNFVNIARVINIYWQIGIGMCSEYKTDILLL